MAERAGLQPGQRFGLAIDHGLCRLCGSTVGQRVCWPEVYADSGQSLRRCGQCAAVYLGPDFTAESLGQFYSHHYRTLYPAEVRWRSEARFFEWRGDREAAALRMRFIAPQLPIGARLFEMGSGFGAFLGAAHAVRPDLQLSASEPDAVNRACLTGGASIDFVDSLQDLPPAGLDAVVAFHVLEHLAEPRAFLEWVGGALVPGGRAWIEVPDLMSEWRSRNFVHPAHLSYFSAATLSRLAAAAGLQIEFCGDHPAGGALAGSLLAVLRQADAPLSRASLEPAPVTEIAAVDRRIDSVEWRWGDRLRRLAKRCVLRVLGPGPLGELQRWRNHRRMALVDAGERGRDAIW